jgi:hypothetical protein
MEPEGHYCVHKSPPVYSIPNKLNSVHTSRPHFFNKHFNIVLPSAPRSTMYSLQVFRIHFVGVFISNRYHVCCVSQLDLITIIIHSKSMPTNYKYPYDVTCYVLSYFLHSDTLILIKYILHFDNSLDFSIKLAVLNIIILASCCGIIQRNIFS